MRERPPLKYDDGYQETVSLTDGRRVRLRLILPSDKALLAQGFDKLSEEARYARFLTPKKNLSGQELEYLTEVDGINHFALGAVRRRSLGTTEEGLGTARFIRLGEGSDTAEPAVTILDDYQGQGLGGLLLQRLIDAAWERDIRWFRTELLARNVAMKKLLESKSAEARFEPSGDGCLVATFPIPEPAPATVEPNRFKRSGLYRLLAQVAGADVTVVPRATQPPSPPAAPAAPPSEG